MFVCVCAGGRVWLSLNPAGLGTGQVDSDAQAEVLAARDGLRWALRTLAPVLAARLSTPAASQQQSRAGSQTLAQKALALARLSVGAGKTASRSAQQTAAADTSQVRMRSCIDSQRFAICACFAHAGDSP